MTNSEMLMSRIRECGFTISQFADEMGITRQGLYKKIYNKSEFKQSEIEKSSRILKLNAKQEKEIFFAAYVG